MPRLFTLVPCRLKGACERRCGLVMCSRKREEVCEACSCGAMLGKPCRVRDHMLLVCAECL